MLAQYVNVALFAVLIYLILQNYHLMEDLKNEQKIISSNSMFDLNSKIQTIHQYYQELTKLKERYDIFVDISPNKTINYPSYITGAKVAASSSWDGNFRAENSMLNNENRRDSSMNVWHPDSGDRAHDSTHWISHSFLYPVWFNSIKIQNRWTHDQYVEKFMIDYSVDGEKFTIIGNEWYYQGKRGETVTKEYTFEPVYARVLRIRTIKCVQACSMRLETYYYLPNNLVHIFNM